MNLFVKQSSRLIKGCKANDRSAQEGLYKQFYAEMLRICYRYLKTDDLASEALNTGFLKVFSHINEFDEVKGELGAWIRTIMIRTCIDLSRKELKFSSISNYTDDLESVFVEPTILSKLYAEDLLKSIRKLPEASKLVFNLSVLDGYSHREIAGQLNISESTSRWHLSEAKKLLRAMLTRSTNKMYPPTDNNKAT
ncbi:RNA polymerase sigma factor [Pedobacter metabolipauper]|uniref:RNA polymerase sigma-70 factor (ECF subfamily) n=1 Tax=Pedobacter metabolipauper TaxID=425513 RepID=A0A4R6SZ56_9SPHI|nr:sigma-70 family RNA polymerase sigma factor [Pedobacter metabolipauper]TDQ11914.1 RNA polymerase sigma-70 factor (ECF subfamily) [Pedobacter metabolipauper]